MDNSPNIEKFNDVAGYVFARLYESFPVPIWISAIDFLKTDDITDPQGHTGAELTEDAAFFEYSVQWLSEAGYISIKDNPLGSCWAVFTAKGLETMKAMPNSLSEPLGSKISTAVKTGSTEILRGLVDNALGIGLGLILK